MQNHTSVAVPSVVKTVDRMANATTSSKTAASFQDLREYCSKEKSRREKKWKVISFLTFEDNVTLNTENTFLHFIFAKLEAHPYGLTKRRVKKSDINPSPQKITFTIQYNACFFYLINVWPFFHLATKAASRFSLCRPADGCVPQPYLRVPLLQHGRYWLCCSPRHQVSVLPESTVVKTARSLCIA